MKTFHDFQNWCSDSIRHIGNAWELRNWNDLLDSICKENHISVVQVREYRQIQNQILNRVNVTGKEPIQKKLAVHEIIFPKLILQRLYELNKEFPLVIHSECYLSANALTRQVVELYILALVCRSDPSYKKILAESGTDKFSDKKSRIESLKKSSLKLEYIEGKTKDEFLDWIYSAFGYYSCIFHPSPLSFSKYIWVLSEKDSHTKLYSENKNLSEKDMIATFTKDIPITDIEKKGVISYFYLFSALILMEISLAEQHEKTK